MADITTTIAQNSGFIPNAWAARALEVLRANIVLTKLIARDSDFEPGWVGQTLTIPYPGTFTPQSKTADTLATVQTPQNGGIVQITLENHEYVDFIVEDIARTQASQELMDRYIQPAVIALAEKLEGDLVAAAVAGWTANSAVGTAGTNLSAAPIRSARRVLNTQKVPMDSRVLAVSPKDEVALLGDTNLQTYFAFSQQQAIREGSLGRMYGFDLYMSQIIGTDGLNNIQTVTLTGSPTGGTFTLTLDGEVTAAIAYNATTSAVATAIGALVNVGAANVSVTGSAGAYTVTFKGDLAGEAVDAMTATGSLTGGTSPGVTIATSQTATTTNLAFHPNALMMGMRPFRDIVPNSGVESSTMLDPESGLMIRVLHQYSLPYRGHYVGFDILYGYEVLRANHGVLVLS